MEEVDYIEELRKRKEACVKECNALTKELTDLEEFARKKEIKNITLDSKSTLIDLLHKRILDSSPEWKTHIDTLINIPHSDKGQDFLRGGDYFEALFQLAIAIGILPMFNHSQVIFHDIEGYKKLKVFENYLHVKTIKNSGGNEQGISDISFELVSQGGTPYKEPDSKCGELPKEQIIKDVKQKSTNPFYYISVKGYKREKSAAKDYDIPLLSEQLKVLSKTNNNHIVVCVRNKTQFLKGLKRSRMEFLKNSIDHVIGYDEVIEAFSTFRTNFFLKLYSIEPETITDQLGLMFPQKTIYKPSLSLYFHQELVMKTVLQRIKENPTPLKPHYLCIGVLPRGGKSFIAGGIIDSHRKLKGEEASYNVLFLTSAINETRDQFKEDLLEKYSEFKDFQFIDIVRAGKNKVTPKKFNFVFVSRQLAGKETEGKEVSVVSEGDILSRLKKVLNNDINFDLCFFDEAHIGIDSVINKFKSTFKDLKMPIILMTATYAKPATIIEDPKDLFVWDLQDIKDMKDLPVLKLSGFLKNNPEVLQRYPLIGQDILQRRIQLGQTEEEIATPYLQFPLPNFISLAFTPSTVTHLKDTGSGYDYMTAFKIKEDPELLRNSERYLDWGSLLDNREHALRIRQFLTPEQDENGEFLSNELRKYRAFNQIFSIAQRTGSRPLIGKPFSVIMFLPFGPGMPIGELCRIWGSFLLESRYWKNNFVVMTLSTYPGHIGNPSITVKSAVEQGLCHYEDFKKKYSLKKAIQVIEQEALKYGKGLVLLSGDVAKMGISLKCVDVVCLMSNNTQADDIIQKMYRALTDDPPMKKNGFIIDLNLTRVVYAMFEYDMEKSRRTNSNRTIDPKERTNNLMELCNWGQDGYMIDNPNKTFDDVMKTIRDIVFAGVENRIRLEYGKRDLVENQFKVIESNKELLTKVINILQYTSGKRPKQPKKEKLLERGIGIPKTEVVQEERKETDEEINEPEEEIEPLSAEQIKKKIVDIMITFVNALVIKSNEPWKLMNFKTLMDKYQASKATASRKCKCDEGKSECSSFSNLYDIAYCELKSYAIIETVKKVRKDFEYSSPDLTYEEKATERANLYHKENKGEKEVVDDANLKTQRGEPLYDEELHNKIMNLMDEIFAESSSLSSDWTNYIESLILTISKENTNIIKGGKRRYKTKKNKLTVKDKNVRRTRQNHFRNNPKSSYSR